MIAVVIGAAFVEVGGWILKMCIWLELVLMLVEGTGAAVSGLDCFKLTREQLSEVLTA